MKNRAAVRRDHKPTEIAMQISKEPGSPMVTWRKRNLERPEFDSLPVIEFMDDVKSEIVHQVSHARWNHNRLIGSYAPQRTPIEVIKMCMCHEHEVNGRQMMDFEARLFQSFDNLEPFRPNRIDQDIDLVRLDEKRGMTDPGNADLAFTNLRKLRRHVFAGSLHEQRWDQNSRQEIAFVPVRPRTQSDAGGMPQWNRSIVVWRLANNISPFLFRKADWHVLRTI